MIFAAQVYEESVNYGANNNTAGVSCRQTTTGNLPAHKDTQPFCEIRGEPDVELAVPETPQDVDAIGQHL